MSGERKEGTRTLLRAGENCWRVERADRVAVLESGEAYFRAVRHALLEAERQVAILAWDLHSGILLEHGDAEPEDGLPRRMGPLLSALLERRPGLRIHILVWDYSVIYAAEREWRFLSDSLRVPHPRLDLRFDDRLPTGASHHQKVVVIDDTLAFAGGFDLGAWRWDSAERRLRDKRRTDPDGETYDPFHDVQMAVTGPAARALGDLCAERWERATGEKLPRVETPPERAPWPHGLETAFEDAEVGIARTCAAFEPWPAVREIERFHLDLIAAARDYLYFENQYLSSHRITEALAGRLREPDGPEVVIVITRKADGWLEEGTMGVLRNRLFEMLAEADEHGRLRLYHPRVADEHGEESVRVYVHAKLIIADDRILKIGSSNLSNRSMRVDTEVDLIVERPSPDAAVRHQLHRLLALHFGTQPEEIAARLGDAPSLGEAIDGLVRDAGPSLRPLSACCESELERFIADTQLLDPDEPVDPDYWIRSFVPEKERAPLLKRIARAAAVLAAGLGLVLLMQVLGGAADDGGALADRLAGIRSAPWTPALAILAFAAAGLLGVPLNLLLVVAAVALGPWTALLCGFAGAQLAALGGFGLGHRFGESLLGRWDSEKVRRLSGRLENRGLLSVLFVRLVPVASFALVNLAAGASPLTLRVFALGTLLGTAPGMAVVVLLAHRLNLAVNDPGWGTALAFLAVLAAAVGAVVFVRRSLASRTGG